jgi:hypothetical protein
VENFRITALMGADVLLAPHQTGGCNSVSPHGMKPADQTIRNRRKESPESMAALTRELTGDKGRGWLMRWLPSRAHDDMVIGDLDARLLENCPGRRWIKVRRPDLTSPLTVATGRERDTRLVRFGKEA